MMNTPLFLVIDQGGHASRALVFNVKGEIVCESTKEINTFRPKFYWVEHDPVELIQSITDAFAEIALKLGVYLNDIKAAGIATQRSSIMCWDRKNGAPLSPVISWQDRRASSWINSFYKYDTKIHEVTGLFLTAHYGVSKLNWCLHNIPEVKSALDCGRLAWGPMSSYVSCALLNNNAVVSDPVNASRTLLWNSRKRDWDDDLLNLFNLPRSPLPKCVPTLYSYGDINVGGVDISLKIVTGDQSAALFAFGSPDYELAYINVGTGAFVQRLFRDSIEHSSRLLTSVVYQSQDSVLYVLEGTVNGSGSAIEKMERELEIEPDMLHSELTNWMRDLTSPPLFLNGVSGLGTPFWIPDFESRFIGSGSVQEKMLAVVESIIFLLKVNLEEMEHVCSAPEKIVITGGLAKNSGFCQILSDLSELEVYRPDISEATAMGTAYLLAAEEGHWSTRKKGETFYPYENRLLLSRYEKWKIEMLNAVKDHV